MTMQTNETTARFTTNTTMLLQIGSSWAVCSRTPVPVILARFDNRADASQWQCDHERRVQPKAA
jgi:hypothetical protein